MANQDHIPKRSSRSETSIREGISRPTIPPSRVRPVSSFPRLNTRQVEGSTDKPEGKDYIQELMEIGRKAMDCIHYRLLLRGLNCGSNIISRGVGIRIGSTRFVLSSTPSSSSYCLLSPYPLLSSLLSANIPRPRHRSLTFSLNGHSRIS
jgi:hypothetical protein